MGVFLVYRVGMGRMTWWKKFRRGNGKTAAKNSGMVGNFPQGERKRLPVHEHFISHIGQDFPSPFVSG
jgi:hypothetical protein